MYFVGIDPGASGGIAIVHRVDDEVRSWDCTSMPKTERDVWDWMRTLQRQVVAVIEKVGGFISGNPSPGSAMFKFGRGTGVLIGFLIALNIPFEEVTPQKWQKEFGLSRRKNETKSQYKNRIKGVAQKLFPKENVTLATADALLLALYCQRKYVWGSAG